MGKGQALSKRQRKAQRKATPKASRHVKPVATPAALVEPRGIAAREAVKDDLMSREKGRVHALVAAGDLSAEEAAVELRTDIVAGSDMVHVAGHSRWAERRGGTGVRLQGRDGLAMLHKSGALTDQLVRAGLAYRLIHESVETALGSCLGRVGEGRGARDWSRLSIAATPEGELRLIQSAADLHRAYVVARLNQIERAVFGLADPDGKVWLTTPDGRELEALRRIAGEGQTLREVAGASGHAREATKAALARALGAVAGVLRITGQ
ncbi:MAG TPA: hypothetical protein VFW13_15560 [Phenylobacterium sp.]|nr:hypothetical protein [Phenylobacterium sp.]